jgi:DNA repair protein RadC
MRNLKIEATKASSTFVLIPMITLINFGELSLVNGTLNYTIYKDEEIVWSELENVTVLGLNMINKPISTNGLGVGGCTCEVVYVYDGNISKHTRIFCQYHHPTDDPHPPLISLSL